MQTPRSLFNLTAALLKPTMSTDMSGGPVRAYRDAGTFRCRVQTGPKSKALATHGDRTSYDGKIYCGPEVDVQDHDRIRVGSMTYQVVGVDDNNGMGIFLTILVNAVKPQNQ